MIHEGDIWIVPLNSENPTQITDTPENERWVNLSHDGKRFVFAGWKGGDKEFWLMENFLPE